MYTGYNALSMALAMPENGRVVACEIEETYVNIATPFFKEVRTFLWEQPGSSYLHKIKEDTVKTSKQS